MNVLRAMIAVGGITALGAGAAQADPVKCQAGIEKSGAKLQAAAYKALAKCKDEYAKATAKSEALNVKAGPGCQATLGKAIDMGNPASTLAKTKAALDSLVTKGTCTDEDLAALQHLVPSTFGDAWSRFVSISQIKSAYEQQVALVGTTANIFQALQTNGCPFCSNLGRPPCQRASCALQTGAGNSEAVTKIGGAPLNVPLSGELITDGCQWPGLTTNETATVGGPSIGINASNVAGTLVCTIAIRAEGFTNCGGGAIPNVSYATCQDSDTSDTDECPGFLGAGTLCQAAPNASTGGGCVKFTTSPGTVGNSFSISTSQLRTVAAGQEGPDGVACTADDTSPPTPPNPIFLTTGTVQADVFDYANVNGNQQTIGPIAGTAGPNCANTQAGTLTGLRLVAAFPGADTVGSPLGDTVTTTRLVCQ